MQLFHENGNDSIEGVDVKHACYGGTFALFTAFDRIHSRYWDGRYCVVVSADIAEYEEGPARPSGGCGAVALLLGKGACIDLAVPRASYKANEYDFYKPHLDSPYPVVDGPLSNRCYLNALDSCFTSYRAKMEQLGTEWRPIATDPEGTSPDFWVFHAPYNKLVAKTFGRVIYRDFLSNPAAYYKRFADDEDTMRFLRKYESVPCRETVASRQVIKGFERISSEWYKSYVAPSTAVPKAVGNCYTASIFMGLISLIVDCGDDLDSKLMGKEIQLFSYGSGTVASLYSLKVMQSEAARQSLAKMVENNDIGKRLGDRRKIRCDEYTQIMNQKQQRLHSHCQRGTDGHFVPQSAVDVDHFYPDTFYLERIDSMKRRFYAKFECEVEDEKGDLEEMKGIEIEPVHPLPVTMKEEEIKENIARFKGDDDVSYDEQRKFGIPNLGHFIGDAVLIGAQKMLDKAQDHGLSTKGAIQIDEVLRTTHRVSTKCSNS